jgi:hypothetical protein
MESARNGKLTVLPELLSKNTCKLEDVLVEELWVVVGKELHGCWFADEEVAGGEFCEWKHLGDDNLCKN